VSERPADICLILEGTYPYVTGGVSSWIHQLVNALPELRFAIFHISATQGEAHEPRYKMPPNVVSLVDVGIHGGDEPALKGEVTEAAAWETIWRYHEEMKDGRADGLEGLLGQISPHAGAGPSVHDFIYGKPSWEIVRRLYETRAPDISFLDYFWTWRFTHLPMFRLLHAAVPEAAVYHTVSTGWAGLVASVQRVRRGRPMLLTEHGIYSRERRVEIDQAEWIYVQRQEGGIGRDDQYVRVALMQGNVRKPKGLILIVSRVITFGVGRFRNSPRYTLFIAINLLQPHRGDSGIVQERIGIGAHP